MCMSITEKLATVRDDLAGVHELLEELKARELSFLTEEWEQRVGRIDHALKRLDAAAIHIGE
jgi:hypothetical protein